MSKIEQRYAMARELYAEMGVDTDQALDILRRVPVSAHCWQLDDLTGFENFGSVLTGGIQATGNYPGKPESVEEFMEHLTRVIGLVPGALKIAIHAIHRITDEKPDRSALEPRHFSAWVDYAKEHNVGLDFNPTYFSHPTVDAGGFTLASSDKGVRDYWIEHGKACRRIGEYFGRELGQVCVTNHWIADGSKDVRIDKMGPRETLMASLDEIFAQPIDPLYNLDSVESKLFGLGVESYTVGSHEFYTNYAMSRSNCLVCLDAGHFHPTEVISDKLSSYLCFGKEMMLHVSRPVRWDSDHVVMLDDETRAIMQEIVRCGALDKVHIGTDYFDASIDRIVASAVGARSAKKALLYALLEPTQKLKELEADFRYTARLALYEEIKTLPFGLVWDMFCEQEGVPGSRWFEALCK